MKLSRWLVVGILVMVVLLAFGTAVLALSPKHQKTFRPVGRSGNLVLRPEGNLRQWLMIKQSALVEVDGSGQPVTGHAISLAGKKGVWGPTTETTTETLSGTQRVLSTSYTARFMVSGQPVTFTLYIDYLPGGAPISGTEPISGSDPISGTDPVSGTDLAVGPQVIFSPDAVRFSIEASGWPFSSTENRLLYRVRTEAKGGPVRDKATHTWKWMKLEPGDVEPPVMATIDGAETEISLTPVSFARGRKLDLRFSFPAFSELKYGR